VEANELARAVDEASTRTLRFGCATLAAFAFIALPASLSAQPTGLENGEWRCLGGDAGHTRFSPLTQIHASALRLV
jgi:hypothetical protein